MSQKPYIEYKKFEFWGKNGPNFKLIKAQKSSKVHFYPSKNYCFIKVKFYSECIKVRIKKYIIIYILSILSSKWKGFSQNQRAWYHYAVGVTIAPILTIAIVLR